MGITDSTLTLISTLVGSGGLVIFIATSLLSNLNQPNISLTVNYNIPPADSVLDIPRISYYEIITKNVGLAQAKNLTLSMFFKANITKAVPVIYDQSVRMLEKGVDTNGNNISFAKAYLPMLSPNAQFVIDVWTNGHNGDSYYVSATYDQGSSSIWHINSKDSTIFPNISAANSQPPIDSHILLIAATVSVISFALAFVHVLGRRLDPKEKGKIIRKIFIVLPASIGGSAFMLIIFEELIRLSVVPSMFLPPLDITHSRLSDTIHNYNTYGHMSQFLALEYATALILIIFITRTIIAYIISWGVTKLVHPRQTTSIDRAFSKLIDENTTVDFLKDFKTHGKLHLLGYSALIVGLPIESILALFFYQSIAYLSSIYLFLIILVVDISRMIFLTYHIAEREINISPHKIKTYNSNGKVV